MGTTLAALAPAARRSSHGTAQIGIPDSMLLKPSRLNPEEGAADAQDDPDVGVLTFDQSTPPGATERIHSRKAAPPTRA